MNKGCFVCHTEVESDKYAVHYAFGAIICSPACYVAMEEATQKALVEEVVNKAIDIRNFVGDDNPLFEKIDGKENNA